MFRAAQLHEFMPDFAQLAQVTDCVRIYSVDLGLDAAIPLAAKHNMQVLLGIWIGFNEEFNQRQIAIAASAARTEQAAVATLIEAIQQSAAYGSNGQASGGGIGTRFAASA